MLAAFYGLLKMDFLSAGDFKTTDGIDGVHFTAENNAQPSNAFAGKVRAIFDGKLEAAD